MDNTDLTRKDYARELGINIARARTVKGYSQNRAGNQHRPPVLHLLEA